MVVSEPKVKSVGTLQVSLMLTDEPDRDPETLEPEVRPRFQSEYEAWQEGVTSEADPAAVAEEAGSAKKKGRPARGKWQVSDLVWKACQHALQGAHALIIDWHASICTSAGPEAEQEVHGLDSAWS